MTTLQELITRGRFIMSDAPSRLKVFEAVDGRRTAKDIADLTGRHENNVRRDLTILFDAGLIQPKGDASRRSIFEKVPLARTIPIRYFGPIGKRPQTANVPEQSSSRSRRTRGSPMLAVPNEQEILEIARNGEDQLHEFKAPGTEASKITKEIAAMLNTSGGGMILYGIEDDGTIVGTDVSRQALDQPLQNSVKNGITPAATIRLSSVDVLGTKVLVIIVPPWTPGGDIYQYQERHHIRKGTNVFVLKPEEIRSMSRGKAVV